MKKFIISAAVAALMFSSLTSCMGQFALSKDLYAWNSQVGNKFVNELVFFAFFILPVYEVCGLADIFVLNSIEFWSGSNPITASVKTVTTDNGTYLVKCDGKGYDIRCNESGESYRLDFAQETQTWSVNVNDKTYPLVTFVDDTHVAMPDANGNWNTVELSAQGLMAYRNTVAPIMAAK